MYFNKNSIISIIDSGIGGISVLKQLIKKYNYGNYIYYADNLYMPYGKKSKSFIKRRVESIIDMLIEKYNVSCVIVACNTASTSIDVVKYKNVLIMKFSTDAVYLTTPLTKNNLHNKEVVADPTLAKLIEQNIINEPTKLNKILKRHIKKLKLYQYKQLCLGCTHYELIANYFKSYLPKTKIILNSSFILNDIEIERSEELNIIYLMSKQSSRYYNILNIITKS